MIQQTAGQTSHAAAGAGRRPASRWALLLALAGCAEMPVGPTVAVMPWQNKHLDVFVQDDALCRNWGSYAVGLPGH